MSTSPLKLRDRTVPGPYQKNTEASEERGQESSEVEVDVDTVLWGRTAQKSGWELPPIEILSVPPIR